MWARAELCGIALFGLAVGGLTMGCASRTSPATVERWQPTVDVSPAGDFAFAPDVAVDASGNGTAVWVNARGSVGSGIVQSAVRPAGGGWQAPTNLSTAGVDGLSPQVAVNARGEAVAVWLDTTGSIVMGAARTADGTWQPATKVSGGGAAASTSTPRVAIDAHGDGVTIWPRSRANENVLQAAIYRNGVGWQEHVDVAELSATGHPSFAGPQLGVDAHGNATVVWTHVRAGNMGVVRATTQAAGGDWRAPIDLSRRDARAADAHVAIGGRGTMAVVWTDFNAGNGVVQGAVRRPGEAWQAPRALSGAPAGGADVAVDGHDNAIAVWTTFNSVQTAIRPAAANWHAPLKIANGVDISHTQIAANARGDAAAVWMASEGATVHASARRAGSDWQPPSDLLRAPSETPSAQTAIAVDPRGHAIAIWDHNRGPQNLVVQAASYR